MMLYSMSYFIYLFIYLLQFYKLMYIFQYNYIKILFSNGSRKVIQGEGMPQPKKKGKRGKLFIAFEVKFPEELSEDVKAKIKKLLPQN